LDVDKTILSVAELNQATVAPVGGVAVRITAPVPHRPLLITTGDAMVADCALMTAEVATELHPDKEAVTVYDPGVKLGNTPVVLVVPLRVPPKTPSLRL
jgi:hypothetical protein